MLKALPTHFGAALLLGNLACSSGGATEGDNDTPPDNASGDASLDDPADVPNDGTDPGATDPADTGPLTIGPAPEVRLFRLTHTQWENTVRDLLLLPVNSGASSSFPNDPTTAGSLFDNNAATLEVDQVLWQGYQREAATLAEQVTADPLLFDPLLPDPAATDAVGARAFIEQFGQRAFRRPLVTAEIDRYAALYELGTSAYSDQLGFVGGIRLLIEAFLQSPHFLYRVESSTQVEGTFIPLSDWEVGQRLSYFLVNSMPDDTLLEVARAGELRTSSQVQTQAERLLLDGKSRQVLNAFHAQLFDVAGYASIAPSPSFFPAISSELPAFAAEETRLFVEDVVFERRAGLAELLLSSASFVNAELAAIYGLTGTFGDEFVRAELEPAERRGLLTQVGFLAGNATSVDPDPIHRGVFIAKRLACINISAPPNGVPALPPVIDATNREIVAAHTESDATCRACHGTLINPYGFPFENYDAAGAYRTTDNGFPVDATSTPNVDSIATPVENALELAEALAASQQVHDCYARHLVEYAFGRAFTETDQALVLDLSGASQNADPATLDLVVRLVTSPAFLNRHAEELP